MKLSYGRWLIAATRNAFIVPTSWLTMTFLWSPVTWSLLILHGIPNFIAHSFFRLQCYSERTGSSRSVYLPLLTLDHRPAMDREDILQNGNGRGVSLDLGGIRKGSSYQTPSFERATLEAHESQHRRLATR